MHEKRSSTINWQESIANFLESESDLSREPILALENRIQDLHQKILTDSRSPRRTIHLSKIIEGLIDEKEKAKITVNIIFQRLNTPPKNLDLSLSTSSSNEEERLVSPLRFEVNSDVDSSTYNISPSTTSSFPLQTSDNEASDFNITPPSTQSSVTTRTIPSISSPILNRKTPSSDQEKTNKKRKLDSQQPRSKSFWVKKNKALSEDDENFQPSDQSESEDCSDSNSDYDSQVEASETSDSDNEEFYIRKRKLNEVSDEEYIL